MKHHLSGTTKMTMRQGDGASLAPEMHSRTRLLSFVSRAGCS